MTQEQKCVTLLRIKNGTKGNPLSIRDGVDQIDVIHKWKIPRIHHVTTTRLGTS